MGAVDYPTRMAVDKGLFHGACTNRKAVKEVTDRKVAHQASGIRDVMA